MTSSQVPSSKKNAIVCLVRGKKNLSDYDELIERNLSLQRNFSGFSDCDNLIFHEGNITSEQQSYVKDASPNSAFVTLPDKCFSKKHADRFLPYENTWRLGYKHMCRFFSVEIYPLLEEYQYYWRLDDDCFLHGELNFDPFEKLADSDCLYGYVREKIEGHKLTRETLPEFSRKYLEAVHPEKVNDVDVSALNYYNNFHVSSVAFWSRPEVVNFLGSVDESGGIYKYRWGDSTIQAIAVRMFSEPEQRMKFEEVRYEHRSHNWKSY